MAMIALGWSASSLETAHDDSHLQVMLHGSVIVLEQMVNDGDLPAAKAGISAFNSAMQSTQDPYTASLALWQSLNKQPGQP